MNIIIFDYESTFRLSVQVCLVTRGVTRDQIGILQGADEITFQLLALRCFISNTHHVFLIIYSSVVPREKNVGASREYKMQKPTHVSHSTDFCAYCLRRAGFDYYKAHWLNVCFVFAEIVFAAVMFAIRAHNYQSSFIMSLRCGAKKAHIICINMNA
jgi:hypothetical protein